jgi:hypothetical protein
MHAWNICHAPSPKLGCPMFNDDHEKELKFSSIPFMYM